MHCISASTCRSKTLALHVQRQQGGGVGWAFLKVEKVWLRLTHLRCTELTKGPERGKEGVRTTEEVQPGGAHSRDYAASRSAESGSAQPP